MVITKNGLTSDVRVMISDIVRKGILRHNSSIPNTVPMTIPMITADIKGEVDKALRDYYSDFDTDIDVQLSNEDFAMILLCQ